MTTGRTATMIVLCCALAPLPASAQPYDDPALVVCEAIIKMYLPASTRYQRESSSITGSAVRVSFTKQIATTAPEPASFTCHFKRSSDGQTFTYESSNAPDLPAICSETMALEMDPSLPLPELKRRQAILQKCSTFLSTSVALVKTETATLTATGLYPIKAKRTTLGAPKRP